jgi:hypothetical protein
MTRFLALIDPLERTTDGSIRLKGATFGAENAPFLRCHCVLNPEHLPRQARDKHMKTQKRGGIFSGWPLKPPTSYKVTAKDGTVCKVDGSNEGTLLPVRGKQRLVFCGGAI